MKLPPMLFRKTLQVVTASTPVSVGRSSTEPIYRWKSLLCSRGCGSSLLSFHLYNLIRRCSLQRACLVCDQVDLQAQGHSIRYTLPIQVAVQTHHFLRDVSLNNDLVIALRILADTCARGEFLGKEFGGLLHVYSKGVQAVNRCDMFSLVSRLSLDGDFSSLMRRTGPCQRIVGEGCL